MEKIIDLYYNPKTNPIKNGKQSRWWECLRAEKYIKTVYNGNRKLAGAPDVRVSHEQVLKLMDYYNLKGFEFGQWLNQAERIDHVLAAASCLNDLEKVFGKNIGIDGNVGLAFGARGSKGAAAHFEPVNNMINLTKKQGAGCLAHEYGHALDYNLGAYVDQNRRYAFLSGGSSTALTIPENTGGPLRTFVNKIVDFCANTDGYKKIRNANPKAETNLEKRFAAAKGYYLQRTEIFARFCEVYFAHLFESNQYLAKEIEIYEYKNNWQYIKKAEFKKIKPTADKLFKLINKTLNK
ncbi:MAG: hypothetical protein MJ066_05760 [Clostridia bacterium]|nr:hypothetical protein [Clostridia bacterium]